MLIRNRVQISLLILSEVKRINELLFQLKSSENLRPVSYGNQSIDFAPQITGLVSIR